MAKRRFGEYVFEPQTGELWREGQSVHLAPLPGKLLSLLTERPGQLVGRRRIRELLWGDQHLEWETSLYHCVAQLRRALGDSGRDPAFVENVPKKGYRFIAQVKEEQAPLRLAGSWKRPWAAGAALMAVLLLAAGLASLGFPTSGRWKESPADGLVKQGEYLLGRPSLDGLRRALPLFREAVRADASNARAWSGLAKSQLLLYMAGRESAESARKSARKAVELDAENVDAQVILADLASVADHDLERSRRLYEKALAADPGNSRARLHYATYFQLTGNSEEALRQIEMALDSDPASALLAGDAGWFYLHANRPGRAEDLCRRSLRLDPGQRHARECLVYVLNQTGQRREALREAETLLALLHGSEPEALDSLAEFHRRMIEWYSQRPRTQIRQALHFAALGDEESALRSLGEAVRMQLPQVILSLPDPRLAPLRDNPFFQSILNRYGLDSNRI